MLLSRVLRRTLCSAAKSETSAAAAATSASAKTANNPLEQFFEVDRSTDEEKPVIYGTALTSSLIGMVEYYSSVCAIILSKGFVVFSTKGILEIICSRSW